jgi:ATP-GRASP peptide maturase of grasp-with-spasm system
MILIISINNDYSTTSVIEWLNFFNKKFIRINDGDEILLSFTGDEIVFNVNNICFNLSEIKSCWYRRGSLNLKFNINNKIKQFHEFNTFEAIKVEQYIYYILGSLRTINNYSDSNVNKLIISDIARKLKIKTPDDYLINSKKELKKLDNKHIQGFITKSICGNPAIKFNNFTLINFTQKINLEDIETDNFALSLVQNYIEKKYELRIFYLDKSFYTMAIFSQSDSQTSVDFRNYNKIKPNRTVPYNLPLSEEQKIINLMDKLNLNCGSIDMIVDKNNEYVFLEVNPIGQFGMVSNPCNYNLNKVIAEYL